MLFDSRDADAVVRIPGVIRRELLLLLLLRYGSRCFAVVPWLAGLAAPFSFSSHFTALAATSISISISTLSPKLLPKREIFHLCLL